MSKTYIGVDIGGTSIVAGLVSNGKVEKSLAVDTLSNGSKEDVLKQLFKAIDGVFTPNVQAIGVGCPGFINAEEGTIVNINNIPSLQEVNLVEELKQKYNIPTFIDNDANCFVLGEAYYGAGAGFSNVLGITLGTGLGGGIVINKKAYGGLIGAAGEIGCLPYKNGIIEDYASSKLFANQYHTTGYDLYLKAEKGDKEALAAFKELGNNLGWLISNMLYTLAPEAIVIGGSIAGSFKYFEPEIHEYLKSFLFDVVKNKVVIKPAALENAGMVGAASLCVSQME